MKLQGGDDNARGVVVKRGKNHLSFHPGTTLFAEERRGLVTAKVAGGVPRFNAKTCDLRRIRRR